VHLNARLGVGGQGHAVANFAWEGLRAHCAGSWLDLRWSGQEWKISSQQGFKLWYVQM